MILLDTPITGQTTNPNLIVLVSIVSIVCATIITPLLNYLSSIYLKKNDINITHKGYILKRKSLAFESIEPFISELYNGINIKKNELPGVEEDFSVKKFFSWSESEKNPFDLYYYEFYNQAIKNWFWYTPRLIEQLKIVFDLLHTISNEFNNCDKNHTNLLIIGKKWDKELNKNGILLAKIFVQELPRIHTSKAPKI